MEVLNRSKNGNMFDRGFGTKATSTVQLFDEVTVNMSKNVNFVQFSPFDSSFDILAAGTLDSISVFRICFVNECNRQEMGANEQSPNQEELKFSFQFIHDYIIGSSSNSIAFSPKTNFMSMTPNGNQRHLLCFAIAADDDYGIRILSQQFRHDSNNLPIEDDKQTNHQFIIGHTDYINDMSFEPETGNLLASTSDDCTCCVWSIDDSDKNKLDMKILLSSPGMNVKWHPSEPNKLFVSEKKGIIRFYDIRTRMAVLSFECNRYPLMASDWCNENSFFIGCASAKSLFFWDTSLTRFDHQFCFLNTSKLIFLQFTNQTNQNKF